MDQLTKFLHSFMDCPIGLATTAPHSSSTVMHHEGVTTFVLFRRPPFQVELVLMHPRAPEWPGEHRHPNVDSYEAALFWPSHFIKNGRPVAGPEVQVPVRFCDQVLQVDCVRLYPTDWHSSPYLEYGGAILSVQQWLNDVEPTSVGLDWIGLPLNEGHAQQQMEYQNADGPENQS